MSRHLVLLALPLLGASPFRTEHLRSREAREALAAGRAERALQDYGRLEKELGPRPEVEAGKGTALLELKRHAEAEEAFGKAAGASEPLGSRALLGVGNARAESGNLDGAIGAFREALARDPEYADARHDLEVVLRRKAEASGASRPEPDRKPQPSSTGPEGGGAGSRGEQGGTESGPGEKKGPGPGERREEPRGGVAGGGPAERREPESEAGGSAPGGRLGREEAERLLDALRARERNLPPDPKRARRARSQDAAKDW